MRRPPRVPAASSALRARSITRWRRCIAPAREVRPLLLGIGGSPLFLAKGGCPLFPMQAVEHDVLALAGIRFEAPALFILVAIQVGGDPAHERRAAQFGCQYSRAYVAILREGQGLQARSRLEEI